MTVVTIEEASSRLSGLAELGGVGEAVRITQADKPALEPRVAEEVWATFGPDSWSAGWSNHRRAGVFEPMDEEGLALSYACWNR